MDVQQSQRGPTTVLRLTGRLDASWSGQLSQSITAVIRAGHHVIELDMQSVDYMSSAGLRILLKFYKELRAIGGSFTIASPSESVHEVLELSGFQAVLAGAPAPSPAAAPAMAAPVAADPAEETIRTDFAELTRFAIRPGATMKADPFGRPEGLFDKGFTAADCRSLTFPPRTIALGLGALGGSFAECAPRFGEFLGISGAAVYLPTDGSDQPDYLTTTGSLIPEIQALYGLRMEGDFSDLIRFEGGEHHLVPLSKLLLQALTLSGSGCIAVALVAESAGLVGAALRQSPAGETKPSLEFPAIRGSLSFTAERAFSRSLCLITGVVSRSERPFLRPLGGQTGLHAHLHAAAFRYKPLRKGCVGLEPTIAALFEDGALEGVLHLLHDDRPLTGVGESEFHRGALWLAPLA
jgi:anti-anti-sigma factor